MPNLYDQLASKIRETGAKTLTLDLFDTILLRKSWPIDRQDLQTAAAWKTHLPEFFGSYSPSTILSWRQYAYRELRKLHGDNPLTEFQPSLEVWFGTLVDLMTNFYHVDLTALQPTTDEAGSQSSEPKTDSKDGQNSESNNPDPRAHLLEVMVQDELDAALQNLTPNRPFIDALASLKQALPELKVFFLEDSTYRTAELQKLLDHFEIKTFDGGLSSVDAAVTKRSGRLYQYLQDTDSLASDFELKANLHIGDNHLSDYRQALRAGSFALHYRPIRLRGLRTLIGRGQALHATHRDNHFPSTAQLAPLSLCAAASHHPETRYIIPSELILHFDGLTLPDNLQPLPQLSQLSVTQATVWLLANRHDQAWNTSTITRIITRYLNDNSRSAIYDFCFQNDFPRSDFLLNCRSDDEFRAALLYDLTAADTEFTAHLRQAYVDLAELLPLAQEGIAIVDPDPRHPIQSLFSEFAKLHGVDTPIEAQTL